MGGGACPWQQTRRRYVHVLHPYPRLGPRKAQCLSTIQFPPSKIKGSRKCLTNKEYNHYTLYCIRQGTSAQDPFGVVYIHIYIYIYIYVALGGLVVSVLATGPKFGPAGSIPTEGDGFLRVIKIRSTTSFGGEVKPSDPCRRFTACKRNFGHE
jgi:hypothetical protein